MKTPTNLTLILNHSSPFKGLIESSVKTILSFYVNELGRGTKRKKNQMEPTWYTENWIGPDQKNSLPHHHTDGIKDQSTGQIIQNFNIKNIVLTHIQNYIRPKPNTVIDTQYIEKLFTELDQLSELMDRYIHLLEYKIETLQNANYKKNIH